MGDGRLGRQASRAATRISETLHMRKTYFAATLCAAMAAALAASAQPAKVGQTAAGPALADANGMTLYTYARDMTGYSNCNGPCADAWPPLAASGGDASSGDWSVV